MTPSFLACRRTLLLSAVIARRSSGFSPAARAKAGSGGPAMPMAVPPGVRTRSDLLEVLPAEAVEHEVVAGQRLLEVLGAVVDDDVGAELAHQVRVGRARGRGDVRAEVLGELDRDRADAARAGVDEDLLPGLHVAALDERLPRGERDEGQRPPASSMRDRRRARARGRPRRRRCARRRCRCGSVRGAGVDLVAGREAAHLRADARRRFRRRRGRGPAGSLVRQDRLNSPARIFSSSWLRPAASTSTRTSWSPTTGSGTSSSVQRAAV